MRRRGRPTWPSRPGWPSASRPPPTPSSRPSSSAVVADLSEPAALIAESAVTAAPEAVVYWMGAEIARLRPEGSGAVDAALADLIQQARTRIAEEMILDNEFFRHVFHSDLLARLQAPPRPKPWGPAALSRGFPEQPAGLADLLRAPGPQAVPVVVEDGDDDHA
ncbi:MAG: hypothetical protein MZV65_53330 [Chromatiales bacterium]|nr:hypothetical protein [Chromatiales bacterium]